MAGTPPDADRASVAIAALLARYAELESLHADMLAQARNDDWEAVGATAGRADEVRAALIAAESSRQPLDAEAERAKAALIERTLGAIAELRRLAEPAHATLADQLADGNARRKIDKAYGG